MTQRSINQTTKAAKAFFTDTPNVTIDTAKPLVTAWWLRQHGDSYVHTTYEHILASVEATILYNAENPNR